MDFLLLSLGLMFKFYGTYILTVRYTTFIILSANQNCKFFSLSQEIPSIFSFIDLYQSTFSNFIIMKLNFLNILSKK